uniref:Variant surface glycoprotein 1125.2965 n=1 Tax=Trypanosoma brucei TaxID=5691 RepID=A0A1J0R986_9TRYP|nr:variant surface glycoprotein 1125.2965 [Trypanosoma brucei]
MCGDAIGSDVGAGWQASATKTNINALVSTCKTLVKPKLSPQTLHKALNDFDGKLKSHTAGGKDEIVLGTPNNDGSCGSNANKACADSNALTGPVDDDIKIKATAVCKASKIQPPSVELTPLTGSSQSERPAVLAVAKACLPAFMKKSKMEPSDVDNLKNFLKTAYGESETAFQTKFENLVEEAEVQVYRDGDVKPVKINTINTAEEEHDALNKLRAKQAAAKLASSQNPATPDQKESAGKTGEKQDGDNKATGVNCSSYTGCLYKRVELQMGE